jgi:LCP family protein required for cell wall assembly
MYKDMKLSGNKKNGRYAPSNTRRQTEEPDPRPDGLSGELPDRQAPEAGKDAPAPPLEKRTAAKNKRQIKALKILIVVLAVILALLAVFYCVYVLSVKPPDYQDRTPIAHPAAPSQSTSVSGGDTATSQPTLSSDRKGNQCTFVILGFDDGNGNTDTIMVANFDADNHRLSVVNIPRDTLVNVSWYTKKANSLYSSGGGIQGVVDGLSDILGFRVDFYVLVDLDAFKDLVDSVDGVDFDVPVNMYYKDPAQDLLINLKKGPQHLDGSEALQLVRAREKVWATGDIGRIEMQQKFLMAAAGQILQKRDKLNITELAKIFLNDVKTDLDMGRVVWLGQEFLKMNSGNITFETIPANYWDSVNKDSYVTIYVSKWLELLNAKINPFKEDIKAEELSILTRDKDGGLYVTNGVWAGKKSWGSGGGSASPGTEQSGSAKPSASAEPSADVSGSPPPDVTEDSTPSLPETSPPESSPDGSPAETESADSPPADAGTGPSASPTPEPGASPASGVG